MGSWVRPLGDDELLLYALNKEGCCFISYVLRITSAKPITEEHARKTFTSLYRKTPNLRLRVAEKDGEPWMKYMDSEKINFEVIEDADIYATYNEIGGYELNFEEGPLWTAKFLPWSPNQMKYYKDTTVSGEFEEGKFPHVCHIVVIFSHVITDGYSCIRIMRTILSLLDAVIAGTEIDENKQIATILDLKWAINERQEIEKKFIENPDFLEERKKSIMSIFNETLFEKAYPVDPNLKPRTVCLTRVVDEDTTKRFVSRCKKEGVTVHTGFCAIIESVIVKLLNEAGVKHDSYWMTALHAADNRVYYQNCHDEFGVGMGIMDMAHEIREECLQDFWTFAKQYHNKFKKQHQLKPGLEHSVIEKLTGIEMLSLLDKNGQSSPSKKMTYYCTTNMRDVTNILGNCGDNVNLEYLDRLSTMHLLPTIWLHTFNTFRGKFLHSLQYNAHLVHSDTAQKISDKIFEMFSTVSK